jgi:hypothetical protein
MAVLLIVAINATPSPHSASLNVSTMLDAPKPVTEIEADK